MTSGSASDHSGGNGLVGNENKYSIAPEEIAARAYQIYEEEGRGDGRDTDHWFRAEAELRAEKAIGRVPA